MADPTYYDFSVHGREALFKSITAFDKAGERVDLSGVALFFECHAANIRVALIDDPIDDYARKLYLTVEQVERLPTKATEYAIRDETNIAEPYVWARGTITRTGFKGEPNG